MGSGNCVCLYVAFCRVGRCRLDRQGAGEWIVRTASAAHLCMVVHNSVCCILQLTVSRPVVSMLGMRQMQNFILIILMNERTSILSLTTPFFCRN